MSYIFFVWSAEVYFLYRWI